AQELQEIYEIRAHLSALAVRKGVENITPSELERASGLIRIMDEEDRVESWVDHNREFHHLIDDASRNKQLSVLMRRLSDASALYVQLSMPYRPNELRGANSEHRRL